MRRLAKILLAGTAVATVASAAAEAQTPRKGEVVNEQILLGDVLAGQRLHVIDPADGVTADAVASGNAIITGVQAGDLAIDSDQTVDARVRARTDVEVHGWTPGTKASSAATGNQGEAWATDGGVIDSIVRQVAADGSAVKADTAVRAELSSSGDTDAASAAIGNSQSYAVGTGAYSRSDTQQRQHGAVEAATEASLFHVKGAATLESLAASNSLTQTGNGASSEARALQHTTGSTLASTVGAIHNGQTADARADASANTASLLSRSLEAGLDVRQKHEGHTRAEVYLAMDAFGAASASASGVGNSITADNAGEYLDVYSDQENDGGVASEAAFFGGAGYDVNVSASAFGNTVNAAVCSDCDGQLTASNRQVNTAGVSATARATISGAARTVNSSAHAVGNNAAYHVTRPNN